MAQGLADALAKLGTGKYRDGSSTYAGRPYQPLPFHHLPPVPSQKGAIVRAEAGVIFEHLGWHVSLPDVGDDAGYRPAQPAMPGWDPEVPGVSRVLDIGANIGFYSLIAATLGKRVIAIEADERNVEVMDILRASIGAEVLCLPDVDMVRPDACGVTFDFDVTFMLNVHHWIHKQRGDDETNALMRDLARMTKCIYFQTPLTWNRSFYNVPGLDTPHDVLRLLESWGFEQPRSISQCDHHDDDPRHMFFAYGAAYE